MTFDESKIGEHTVDEVKECSDTISKYITTKKKEEKYYITKDNSDGVAEVLYRLNCDFPVACQIFDCVIKLQVIECRKHGFENNWGTLRLFDSQTQEEICKES